MLNIFPNSSKKFKYIIHHLLNIVVEHFIEIGSNLNYEEIYATVFPLHKQDDKEFAMNFLKTLHKEIIDRFSHEFTPMKEYVLYNILLFVYESSEDGFLINDEISKYLNNSQTDDLSDDEIMVLHNIYTPNDLIGLCFEDLDFLDLPEILEIYKTNPNIITSFFHIDLDYYTELMPDDILKQYNDIKSFLETTTQVKSIKIKEEESFVNQIKQLVEEFKHYVVHKKVHKLLNNKKGKYSETEIQILFDMFSEAYLKDTEIVKSREVDTGRGAVDFHFSKGKKLQALIEIKLDSHQQYKNGLKYQLPTYLLAEKDIKHGFFLLICFSEESYRESEYLYVEAEKLSKKFNKGIYFERINASGNLKSASNVKNEKEIGFTN